MERVAILKAFVETVAAIIVTLRRLNEPPSAVVEAAAIVVTTVYVRIVAAVSANAALTFATVCATSANSLLYFGTSMPSNAFESSVISLLSDFVKPSDWSTS